MRAVEIYGITCMVTNEKCFDGRKRDTYTFTVPGWERCSVTGKTAAKRCINARLSPRVRALYGKEI